MQVYSSADQRHELQLTQTSTVLRIQHLELALQRAVDDISLLQSNLGYVIRVKQELQAELGVREKREEAIVKEYQREIVRRDKEIQNLKYNQQELAALLEQVKNELDHNHVATRQRDDEKRRLERIVQDQKSSLHSLQDELLALKYTADISYQSLSQDNLKFQELERENEQMRFELQKVRNQMEREAVRSRKWEKEAESFKGWLGSVLGLRKVVEGCQGVLMEQISTRLQNCTKL